MPPQGTFVSSGGFAFMVADCEININFQAQYCAGEGVVLSS
jgi:hypothetical protein